MSDVELILLLAGCFVAGFFVVNSVMAAGKRPSAAADEKRDRASGHDDRDLP